MKEKFIETQFNAKSRKRLELVNGILTEYAADGYDLSLRQLYYQLVSRDYIENSQRSYKRLGNLVNKARLAGLIDWSRIEDRGRSTVVNAHWDDPADILDSAAHGFAIDKWEDQPFHVEVMVEKDALSGVLIPVCKEYDVRFTANKGYSSSSMMYRVGKRMENAAYEGKSLVVFYLGDHDPSGIDMTRDIQERLDMFSGKLVQVDRLALNMDQIDEMKPPENPAKVTDSRFRAYVARFGASSWELDAVEPRTLASMVSQAITRFRDDDLWDAAVARESEMKAELHRYARDYRDRSKDV